MSPKTIKNVQNSHVSHVQVDVVLLQFAMGACALMMRYFSRTPLMEKEDMCSTQCHIFWKSPESFVDRIQQ